MEMNKVKRNYVIDKLNNTEIIYCESRNDRPMDVYNNETDVECPFCPGHEEQTPPTVLRAGDPWKMRVVENKFPAIPHINSSEEGVKGLHYVVVETTEHDMKLREFTQGKARELFSLYIDMIDKISSREDIEHIQIFKNYKKEAGASLNHMHSQIIATTQVPAKLKNQERVFKEYREKTGRNLLSDEIKDEQIENERIVFNGEYFLAYCPKSSAISHTVRLVPKTHTLAFRDFSSEELDELSYIYDKLIKTAGEELDDPAMNIAYYFLKDSKDFPFYMEFYFRKGVFAGYELSTGIVLNSITPEAAAETLGFR